VLCICNIEYEKKYYLLVKESPIIVKKFSTISPSGIKVLVEQSEIS